MDNITSWSICQTEGMGPYCGLCGSIHIHGEIGETDQAVALNECGYIDITLLAIMCISIITRIIL